MDIEAAVGSGFEDPRGNEEAKGHRYNQIWRVGRRWCPGGEGVDLVDGKGEGCCNGFYGDFWGVVLVMAEVEDWVD